MKKTVSFSKNSVNVFFHILTACNLTCRHCYINSEQHGQNPLSLSLIESWLEVFANKNKTANLIFLGGEPTLHPDLSIGVKKAKELAYSSVTIDTNGYLFHDILSKVTPDELDCISFSLDGATRQTNDIIRGKGSFDICIAGIRRAVSMGFNTSLIYTVSTENIHELEMIIPILQDLGVDRFFIQVIGIRGKSAKHKHIKYQVSRSDWLTIIPGVAKKVANLGITAIYPKVFLKRKDSFECAGIVAENYFVFPNGRVYRCPLCEDFPLNSLVFKNNRLINTEKINEVDMFELNIPEGCVMNKLIQPGNLSYNNDGTPEYKIACCLLKEEIQAG